MWLAYIDRYYTYKRHVEIGLKYIKPQGGLTHTVENANLRHTTILNFSYVTIFIFLLVWSFGTGYTLELESICLTVLEIFAEYPGKKYRQPEVLALLRKTLGSG